MICVESTSAITLFYDTRGTLYVSLLSSITTIGQAAPHTSISTFVPVTGSENTLTSTMFFVLCIFQSIYLIWWRISVMFIISFFTAYPQRHPNNQQSTSVSDCTNSLKR